MADKVIEYLYPEVSNLYGDPFNVKYLSKCIAENGLSAETVEDSLNSEPYFVKNKPDLVYIGPMTEHSQELVLERLKPYTARIREIIDAGVIFFATGNAIELFEKEIECEDGKVIPCLGLYPFTAKQRMFNRYNSLFLGEFEGIKIVGNKSQFTHSYGDTSEYPFVKVTKGDGLAPGEPFEGIKDNSFFGTYLLGPLLPLNPLFTKHLLKLMKIDDPKTVYEKEAMKAYEIRLAEFENPATELK
ncbi:MAG: hypothetical protein K6E19_00030 [Lachnospiraceae bacterium]|nr:hypothetical protein [Lachnospiraceae bacterium]